jgi:hypothetical protein
VVFLVVHLPQHLCVEAGGVVAAAAAVAVAAAVVAVAAAVASRRGLAASWAVQPKQLRRAF